MSRLQKSNYVFSASCEQPSVGSMLPSREHQCSELANSGINTTIKSDPDMLVTPGTKEEWGCTPFLTTSFAPQMLSELGAYIECVNKHHRHAQYKVRKGTTWQHACKHAAKLFFRDFQDPRQVQLGGRCWSGRQKIVSVQKTSLVHANVRSTAKRPARQIIKSESHCTSPPLCGCSIVCM